MEQNLSAQDLQDLEDLERATRSPRGSGGGDLDIVVSIDCTEAGRIGVTWPEGKHPFEVTKVDKKISQERFDEKTNSMKGGQPYLELELTCIGGDMKGETLSDRLMLAGKGLSRFVIFADALGMYDKDHKMFNGRLIDFIGQQVWGAVITEKSEYQGRSRERSIIDFAGYEPISAFPVPGAEVFDLADDETTVPEEPVEEAPPAPRRAAATATAGTPGGKPPWSKA